MNITAPISHDDAKTLAGMYLCNDCRDKFTAHTGNEMERSHVPLHQWLLATHSTAASTNGQIAHRIDIAYNTAWFLCHHIQEVVDLDKVLLGRGEPDESPINTRLGKDFRAHYTVN